MHDNAGKALFLFLCRTRESTLPISGNGYGDRYACGGAGKLTGRMGETLGETDGNQYLWTMTADDFDDMRNDKEKAFHFDEYNTENQKRQLAISPWLRFFVLTQPNYGQDQYKFEY